MSQPEKGECVMTKSRQLCECLQALAFLSTMSIGREQNTILHSIRRFRTDRGSRLRIFRTMVPVAMVCLLSAAAMAGVTASISGTVHDASEAIIAGATVSATNTETGVVQTQVSNARGFYSFQSLPLGHYDIQVEQAGFKLFRETGLVLDVNSALVVDAVLRVGQTKEVVEVSAETLHVETSSTQLG